MPPFSIIHHSCYALIGNSTGRVGVPPAILLMKKLYCRRDAYSTRVFSLINGLRVT